MKTTIGVFALLLVFCLAAPVQAAEPIKVEVLFMNHGPLRATLNNMRTLFAKYEGKIAVDWYDFDSREGEKFMQAKGIADHIPLLVWINDKTTFKVNGADVQFKGFPSGTGPAMFQGSWDMNMLDTALNQATR